MGRLLPFVLLSMTCFAAMAFMATAHRYDDQPDHHLPQPRWVHVPQAEKDHHIQELGRFAVKRHNYQNHDRLYFLHVIDAEKLVRAPGHYTYRLLIKAFPRYRHNPVLYKSQVMEDAARHGRPPVFSYLLPANMRH